MLEATDSDLGRRVATALNGGLLGDTTRTVIETVAPEQLAAAESTAVNAVLKGSIRGYLVLDRSMFIGKSARYSGTNATSFTDMRRIENVVNHEVMAQQLRSLGVTAAEADRLKQFNVGLRAERINET